MAIDFISRIRSMETALEEARASQRGKEYVEICDELGTNPDDQELYDQGMAEILSSRERVKEQDQKEKPDYQGFYKR